jgi:hypothetical protein
MPFDYTLDFKKVDFRRQPELDRVGKGEQGVLLVEPYKSEILPHWRFRTPEVAKESSEHIYKLFLAYLQDEDFVGADMARKFLQMGFTRARRYANHRGGKKYDGPVPADKKGQSGAHGRSCPVRLKTLKRPLLRLSSSRSGMKPSATPTTNDSAPNFKPATASEPQIPTFI